MCKAETVRGETCSQQFPSKHELSSQRKHFGELYRSLGRSGHSDSAHEATNIFLAHGLSCMLSNHLIGALRAVLCPAPFALTFNCEASMRSILCPQTILKGGPRLSSTCEPALKPSIQNIYLPPCISHPQMTKHVRKTCVRLHSNKPPLAIAMPAFGKPHDEDSGPNDLLS